MICTPHNYLRLYVWRCFYLNHDHLNVIPMKSSTSPKYRAKTNNDFHSFTQIIKFPKEKKIVQTIHTFVVIPLIRSLLLPSTDKNFDFKKLGVRSIKMRTFPSEPFLQLFCSLACKSTIFPPTLIRAQLRSTNFSVWHDTISFFEQHKCTISCKCYRLQRVCFAMCLVGSALMFLFNEDSKIGCSLSNTISREHTRPLIVFTLANDFIYVSFK